MRWVCGVRPALYRARCWCSALLARSLGLCSTVLLPHLSIALRCPKLLLQRRPCLHHCRCKAAALAMQQRLVAEDGTSATVQHLHQTIYGALLEGVVYK